MRSRGPPSAGVTSNARRPSQSTHVSARPGNATHEFNDPDVAAARPARTFTRATARANRQFHLYITPLRVITQKSSPPAHSSASASAYRAATTTSSSRARDVSSAPTDTRRMTTHVPPLASSLSVTTYTAPLQSTHDACAVTSPRHFACALNARSVSGGAPAYGASTLARHPCDASRAHHIATAPSRCCTNKTLPSAPSSSMCARAHAVRSAPTTRATEHDVAGDWP
mmetsp:Transcript_2778/g.10002  ORF Transcript_2778/g.10002 Transcript_2778/m.10002 type:complete len:227 (+) Transcript_2778:2052-2732(+)